MGHCWRVALWMLLALVGASLAGVGLTRMGSPTGQVLRVAPVVLPTGERATLVLSAADPRRPQPRRSTLILVDREGRERRLSPEAHYNFWDLSVGDVDGDGRHEVGLCTFSRTVHDPQYARRFFVYAWTDDGDLEPIWRGSRLCRPYINARLCDINCDGRAELVSVERGLGGGLMLVAYEWNQFGFWGLGHSGEVQDLAFLGPASGGPGALVRVARAGTEPRVEHWVLRAGIWKQHSDQKG